MMKDMPVGRDWTRKVWAIGNYEENI